MNQEIEIEFKNMLTDKEFTQLIQHFNLSPHSFFVQENEYFDTKSFDLKNQQSALRIRKKGEQFTLTLKQPATEGLLETHQALSLDEVNTFKIEHKLPSGNVTTVLQQMGVAIQELHSLGTLTTRRGELPYKNGLLVLDHSFYLNSEDFELEYEVSEFKTGKTIFEALLKEHAIPKRQTKNKIVRFYERSQIQSLNDENMRCL
ncbi:uncharacterized protein YjbK [Pullulanibacillus pueri]|uniref:Putative triphosphatase YjbK n=1 Tax=Pullulanibacillus pueri TaxID=1437324 RepID=A0A8J3EM81_9BACL|nr:CYTH domain-containing protein [Pullulanibacillus pueri]MBM7680599.1 uncharacterized protein YjbK [Pullulanibacillus pueri]GGH83977.1 putative triphosphatase YjbK [Pullulanibacillus pueri]